MAIFNFFKIIPRWAHQPNRLLSASLYAGAKGRSSEHLWSPSKFATIITVKRLKPIQIFAGIGSVLVAFGGTGLLIYAFTKPFFNPTRYIASGPAAKKSTSHTATAVSPLTGLAVE